MGVAGWIFLFWVTMTDSLYRRAGVETCLLDVTLLLGQVLPWAWGLRISQC